MWHIHSPVDQPLKVGRELSPFATFRGEALPEQWMVNMPPAIELYGGLEHDMTDGTASFGGSIGY